MAVVRSILATPLSLTDHTSGLSSSWPHPIHCTTVTGKLLVKKFKIDPKLVVSLSIVLCNFLVNLLIKITIKLFFMPIKINDSFIN